MLKSLALVLLPAIAAAQTQDLVIHVPDPAVEACFVNTVYVRSLGRIGSQILLEAIPIHAGSVISLACQDGTLMAQGPTFGADFAMDSPAAFPPGVSAQRKLNILAIDIGSFPSGKHWFNATFDSGATGSILVAVPVR